MAESDAMLHVGLTRDFLEKAPDPWRMGLDWLRARQDLRWSWLDAFHPEVRAEQVQDVDAVIAWTPRWRSASLTAAERLVLIARWGVGYDHVDLQACTDAGVMVALAPDAVRRPVATANVTMILALSTRLFDKDRDVRAGLWATNSLASPGVGLQGKCLGSIGFGNVAKETFRLMSGFDMRYMACSPNIKADEAAAHQVQAADLRTVLRESDFLMINCPLTETTRHLLGEAEFAVMKPTAFLINLSRGAITEEKALLHALQSGQMAGAGLDVFDKEPLPGEHPLTTLPQVILAPHSLALTEDLFLGMERQHQEIMEALLKGSIPPHVVNRDVLQSPRLHLKLETLANRMSR